MECFIQGVFTGAVAYALGHWIGHRRGAYDAVCYMYERYPQLPYWEKVRRGQAN